ncbi:hypothetical protein V1277_004743 [Bradyrhizobium sp. AZCC 1588]
MSLRSRLLIALATTLLGSTAASAGLVAVTSYEMNNGNGTVSLGTYNYLDGAYSGTSPAVNSITEAAPLTGGTGILTNGVVPTTDYTLGPQQYVGWKYTDPVLNFFLKPGSQISQITLYFANPVQVENTTYGGLVGLPGQINLTIGGVLQSLTPTFSALSSVVEKATFTFDTPFSYQEDTDFQFQLMRGGLLADSIYYHSLYPGDQAFNVNAFDINKQPWIMLSEVEFTAAVPEPSTWIMMILGFAGVGFGMYRRNVKPAPAVA